MPGPRRLSLTATAVVGIVGSGIGLTIAELAGGGHVVARFLLAVAGAIGVLLVVEAIAARRRAATRPVAVAELIAEGESATLEFKGSARRNRHTGERGERLELVIAKTIAGFLNAAGGTLLIGVADEGAVVGIGGDCAVTAKGNRDGIELWLRDYLAQRLGTEALRVAFEALDGHDVCRVDVDASTRPVLRAEPGRQTADLYVRAGNTTRRLLTDEAIAYVAERFPAAVGR